MRATSSEGRRPGKGTSSNVGSLNETERQERCEQRKSSGEMRRREQEDAALNKAASGRAGGIMGPFFSSY